LSMTQLQDVTSAKINTFSEIEGVKPTDWGKLPMKLRQRWWKETDYGKNKPDEALLAAIMDVIAGKPYNDPTEQPPEGQINDPATERDRVLAEKAKQAGKP
jgi:hypothetical protein